MFGRKTQDSDTVVRLIASQLRRDISVGVLAPDTKLKIDELRQRYGGSAHSFREALTLLASEGIVEASAQRGFRVASATQSDLEDISRLRAEIESLGLAGRSSTGTCAGRARCWQPSIPIRNCACRRMPIARPSPSNGTRQVATSTRRWWPPAARRG